MGFFGDLARGFIEGAVSALAEPGRAANSIDLMCASTGWTVNERNGDMAILHFNDPIVGLRKLSLTEKSGDVTFSTSSIAVFDSVPQQVTEYLLARNAWLKVGTWATIDIRQGVALFLIHRMSLNGMTGESFRFACEAMAHEAHDLDAKLAEGGLLT